MLGTHDGKRDVAGLKPDPLVHQNEGEHSSWGIDVVGVTGTSGRSGEHLHHRFTHNDICLIAHGRACGMRVLLSCLLHSLALT